MSAADLDAFVPHQANARITDELVKSLGLPAEVAVARSVEIHGNTSAVSVPLAIEELLAGRDAPPGGLALLLSFGTGLVWAGQVVRLPPAPAGPPRPAPTPPTTDTTPTAPTKETRS